MSNSVVGQLNQLRVSGDLVGHDALTIEVSGGWLRPQSPDFCPFMMLNLLLAVRRGDRQQDIHLRGSRLVLPMGPCCAILKCGSPGSPSLQLDG